ncbi:hypothetical protein PIB30_082341 [Stylosanthes scabra]|uniref:Uncharacterized protein n=1 Tax=Stylosanthes scabra TaxID=79078 RepID=A0ABU6YSR4_9FABA|nr:hypothetical protein [Stylosanthes scabra]
MARFSIYLPRLLAINSYRIMINDILILRGFIERVAPNSWRPTYRRSGLCELPNLLQVSCRRNVDRSGSLLQKLLKVAVLKLRGQSDLMADVSALENVGERVGINPSEGEGKIVSTILFLLLFILLRVFFPFNSIVVLSSFPKAFALLLLIISQVFLEMAENQPENQEAVVPAAGVVQIPRELTFIYRWVANDVLGTPSSLDQQYLDELKLTEVLFGGGIWNGDTGCKLPVAGSGYAL